MVSGAGALGLSAIMAAKVAGADHIIAIDRHRNRLDLAEHFGATNTISGSTEEITTGILAITGTGADYAFDTTGNAAVVRAVHAALNPIGTIALAGVGFGDLSV
ncbi:zinc-binding dehydrogenase, partial [Arthrospira platensis SPKY2]